MNKTRKKSVSANFEKYARVCSFACMCSTVVNIICLYTGLLTNEKSPSTSKSKTNDDCTLCGLRIKELQSARKCIAELTDEIQVVKKARTTLELCERERERSSAHYPWQVELTHTHTLLHFCLQDQRVALGAKHGQVCQSVSTRAQIPNALDFYSHTHVHTCLVYTRVCTYRHIAIILVHTCVHVHMHTHIQPMSALACLLLMLDSWKIESYLNFDEPRLTLQLSVDCFETSVCVCVCVH